MNDPTPSRTEDAPLNPALKRRSETVYDTDHRTPPPIETASSKEGGGEGWPWVWLVVTVVCIVLAVWFLV